MISVLGFLSARPHCDVPDKGIAYSDISTDEKYKAKLIIIIRILIEGQYYECNKWVIKI